jgi:hypothetical protein
MTSEERDETVIRGERREKRLVKRRKHSQMQRHGASIGRIYQNAIAKRLSDSAAKKKKRKK